MADGVKVTFGGKQVLHRNMLMQQLSEFTIRIDRLNQIDKLPLCNRFMMPLGQSCCYGYLLMLKGEVGEIDRRTTNALVIEQAGTAIPKIECKNLIVVHAESIQVGKDSDTSPYIVEIADKRWFGQERYWKVDHPISRQAMFNIPAELYPGDYYTETTKNQSGTPYTWQEIINEVWPSWLLARSTDTAPTLPYTPHGTPIGFDFRGMSAYSALGLLLERIGCALRYKPSTGDYTIEQLDVSSSLIDQEESKVRKYVNRLDNSLTYIDPTLAIFPKGVQVHFHRQATQPGSENVFTKETGQWAADLDHVEQLDATSANTGNNATVLDGTYAQLWDDMPAFTNPYTGTVTNSSQIIDRAIKRMDDFYRMLHSTDSRYRKVYAGTLPFTTSGKCRGVAYYQASDGEWLTETVCHPRISLSVDTAHGTWAGGVGGGTPSSLTTRNRPPLLGPGLPTYPPTDLLVRIDSEADDEGWYDATERRLDPATNTIVDGIALKVKDPNA